MTYNTGALFAFLLQFASAIVTLITWGSALILVLAALIGASLPPLTNVVAFACMVTIVPVSALQLYFGYGIYRCHSGAVNGSLVSNLAAALLYVLIFLFGTEMVILLDQSEIFMAFVGINVVLVILLLMPPVRNELESPNDQLNLDYVQ
ncbi:MAG: hypothetical protein DRP09_03920 [Candidatus Thorarchaeota archaeon]|nr:MAG: hypothetical protein DRP09_03920 [Candidatus Thorarchaeota archaeon]